MMDYLGEKQAAIKIKRAVIEVLKDGKIRTKDLGGTSTTSEMSDEIAEKIRTL